jgi:Flp pilus assembly protein CpaB
MAKLLLSRGHADQHSAVLTDTTGGVAALLADNWLVSRTQVATTTTTIVIAARQLPFGTLLTEDSIQEIPLGG